MKPWVARMVIGFFVLSGAAVAYVAVSAHYWQVLVGGPLERELGFELGTPYIVEDGSSSLVEVMAFESVAPGGFFGEVGFKAGDIVRHLKLNDFFRTLHRGRGESVTIRIVDGGNGPPLDRRPERTLTFVVPNAR